MSQPETQNLENKQSLSEWREVAESVAAFATVSGGTVRIGIRPNGERAGVDIGHNTLENLANDIKNNTDPPQFPSITVDEDGPPVIEVEVDESPIKPVWALGRPFKRVGRTNQRLSREETLRLVEETTGRTWDAFPCEGLEPEDLDRDAIQTFLRRAGQDTDTDTQTVLGNLRLAGPQGLANATALLFAREPQHYVWSSQVRCGRFLGTTAVHFLDEQTLEGTVFAQLDAAMACVARNTRQAFVFTGKLERDVVPEYPTEAVREAIINAICHRDYASTMQVQVRIYDDRLEVWNPGVLTHGLTVEKLYGEHSSHPRNPLVAEAFYRARSAWRRSAKRAGCRAPSSSWNRAVSSRGSGRIWCHQRSQRRKSGRRSMFGSKRHWST